MAQSKMAGNPYADRKLQLSHDTLALHSALLAVAFELRTANMIALESSGDWELRSSLGDRLGLTNDEAPQ